MLIFTDTKLLFLFLIVSFLYQHTFYITSKYLYAGERNFCIHSVMGVLVIIAGFLFGITKYEWLAILLIIGLVLCAEAINASIERLCDYVTTEYNPKIKEIKDIASGAVLVCAFISVIVGGIIFIP